VKIRKWMKVIALMSAMLLLLGLSASCGGGGDNKDGGGGGGSAKTSANSPEEYAQAVCGTLAGRIGELDSLINGDTAFDDPSQLKDAIDKAEPVIKEMAKDLDKISPPADVKDWHQNMVAAMNQAANLFGKLGDILNKPLDQAMADMESLSPELENMQEPFAGLSDLPQAYQDAFNNDSKCQELDILGQATPEA
jgi:hypothetical protein